MPIVSENFHSKKVKNKGINIRTTYKNSTTTCVRNLDNSSNDDVVKGIRIRKEYFKDGHLLYTTTKFDSRIEYTYVNHDNEEAETSCPNCGYKAKVKDFVDGCPYCRTVYNVDYTDKDLGAKYHYDRVLRSNWYRIITFIFDLLISFIICFIYFKNTGRTFNEFDILKVIVYSILLSAVLYYFFYIIDGYIVLLPIIIYKDHMNKKQMAFWNKMEEVKVDKKTFYNNLDYELSKYFYDESSDIIDFDILDYLEFKYQKDKDNHLIVTVKMDIRLIKYDGKIKEENEDMEFSFIRYEREIYKLEDGKNYIKCPHCGNSCDVTLDKCDHCRSELAYYQEWSLLKKD